MNLFNLIKGQSNTASTVFTETINGVPQTLVFNDPPAWFIYDFNNNQVINGVAFQNPDHPEQWLATFVLPEQCPVDPDGKYSLVWTATINGKEYKNTDTFIVLEEGEPLNTDSSLLMLATDKLADNLITDQLPSNFSVSLTDENGNVYYETDDQSLFHIRQLNGSYVVEFNANATVSQFENNTKLMGAYPFVLEWKYSTNVRPINTDFHFLYVVTTKVIMFIASLKRCMDKARNYDLNPNLRFTDQELCYFLLLGLGRINASKPHTTSYTLNNLPKPLEYMLLKCAEYEALSAWGLAEGLSAFQFTGASTTLQIDRSNAISTKLQAVKGDIDNELATIKGNIIRSSGIGILSIQLTPSTNMAVCLPNSFILNRLFRNKFII